MIRYYFLYLRDVVLLQIIVLKTKTGLKNKQKKRLKKNNKVLKE